MDNTLNNEELIARCWTSEEQKEKGEKTQLYRQHGIVSQSDKCVLRKGDDFEERKGIKYNNNIIICNTANRPDIVSKTKKKRKHAY